MATELVAIELNLRGAEGVYADMQKLDTMVRQLGGRHRIELELGKSKQRVLELTGEINETTEKIDKLKAEIKSLNKELIGMKSDDAGFEELQEEIAEATEKLEKNQEALKESKMELKDVRQEVNELSNALGRVKPLGRVFSDISLTVARLGSALQSAGNALTRFSAPVRMLMGGAIMGAGYNLLNKATEGLKSGFSRYDTMKKYVRLMEEYSTESYDAERSIADLDKSVLGLPIALDDAVSLAQRYTLSLGDMERGTQLAIATNNAFLASMATENQRYQGMLQMQDLLNGKKLNSREWMSLGASMGKAINEIGKEFGYTNDNMGEFRQELYAGNIATKDFLDALEKVGTGNGSLVKLAAESKNTWEAFFSRIGTAFSRVGYNVLLSMDKLVETASGGKWNSLNSLLDDKIIPSIDKLKDSAVAWIDANPDRILDFVNSIKGIDWKGIFSGFAEGLSDIAETIKGFADAANGVDLSWLGKLFSKSGAWGWFLTVGGGLFKGTRHIWAGIGTAITALLRHFTAGKLEGGIFGRISSIFGKKKDMSTAEQTAKKIPTVADSFKGAFGALQGLMTAAGAVTLVSGAGFVAFKSAKSILKDLKEMTDLVNGGGWDNVGYVGAGVIGAIGVFTDIFQTLGKALGPQGLLSVAIASAASFLIAGTFAADMWAIKQGVIQIRDTIAELDNVASAIKNMKGIGTLGEGVKEKFRTTIDAINEIKQMFVGKNGSPIDRGQVEAGLPTFSIGKVTALTNIASVIEQMQSIAEQFNKLSTLTVQDPSAVIGQIKSACDKLQGISGPKNIEAHTTAVANALKQIKTMATRFNSLAGMTVNADGFGAFVQQIKNALDELKGLDQTMTLDIKVVLGDGFRTSVNGVVKQIGDARTSINNALKRIPTRVTRHISVSITASVNTRQAVNAITSGANTVRDIASNYSATGGMVYRAHGGGIPWKRRGTDTVPAMLTPGEYVHNRRAVSTFGIDFMRKVNNLDIKGAMAELMTRAGHMANVNRGANITNNYNNNQKVVINNNGNTGAGFTFKSASRFVGAI